MVGGRDGEVISKAFSLVNSHTARYILCVYGYKKELPSKTCKK